MGKKKTTIHFQVDLNSLRAVGRITDGEKNQETDKLSVDLSKRIVDIFARGFKNWVPEYISYIESGNHIDAFNLMKKNKWTLTYGTDPLLEKLLLLDSSKLSKEQRKDLLIIIVATASVEQNFGRIEAEIEQFLVEFGDEVESELKQSILLGKANSFLQNGKFNVANKIYRDIIKHSGTSSVDLAFSYRCLAKIVVSEQEKIQYYNLSTDKFLEAGKRMDAITNMVLMSQLYEKKEPIKALSVIDQAIELYDSEDSLDKETQAGLLHKKAAFLFSLNKHSDALKSAESACDLRQDLIGIEYARYSSHALAKSLCEVLKLEERVLYHSTIMATLAPKIGGKEFDFQNRVIDALVNSQKIDTKILEELEKSEFNLLKFCSYIINAQSETLSFEKKLECLDKANFLLNKDDFNNTHFNLFHFTTAEVYRKGNVIEEAINNYEQSLTYNPYHLMSIQNCGAILWQNKMWAKSLEFFRARIKILGDSSTLLYAVARSYFELGNYQEAFNYFRKVEEPIGVDISAYINKCLKNDKDIKLEQNTIEVKEVVPICLDSFKETLKEFASSISTKSRMYFWKNESGKYKWDTRPEERGKQFLVNALEMKYGKDSIEIIQESVAGAGIIDLYIILRGGLKIVIELKICGGAGYSSTYALSGEDQIIHYLKNTSTKVGILVVFDGRSREFGKGFKEVQSVGNYTIYTTAIDMSPQIKE